MSNAWPMFILFTLFDNIQSIASSVISGMDLVHKVQYLTMISYWVFGIPLSIVAMFKLELDLYGLWFGPVLATAINFTVYEFWIIKSDWK